MEDFFNEIERGLTARVYRLSLSMALCIPDICGALESEDGKASGKKYKAWYNKYMFGKLSMTADDCYYFRCSFLHQGSTEHDKSQFKKILFVEPSPNFLFHNNEMGGALNIDIEKFCCDMIAGGRKWYEEVKNEEHFKNNYDRSFKRYPKGLSPYIVGIPVFA